MNYKFYSFFYHSGHDLFLLNYVALSMYNICNIIIKYLYNAQKVPSGIKMKWLYYH